MKKISKFFLLLILLMAGMSNAWAAVTFSQETVIFIEMEQSSQNDNWWNNDGCYHYAKFSGASGTSSATVHLYSTTNTSSSASGAKYYFATIPAGSYSQISLYRGKSQATLTDYYNVASNCITLDVAKNEFGIVYNANFGNWQSWKEHKETSTASSTPDVTEISAGETVTFTSALTSNETYNMVKSTSYQVTPGTSGTDWTIDGDNITFLTANTYSVTATVTYNAKGFTSITKTATAKNTITVKAPEPSVKLSLSDGYNGLKQAITLTAAAKFFTPTSYTFYYAKDGGDYTAIDEASAEASTTYTPTAAGSYTFKVVASDGTYNVEATTTAVTCYIPAYLVYATGSADWNAKATASAAVNDIISVTIDGTNLRLSTASGQNGYCFFAFRTDDATGWNVNKCFGSTKTNADEEVKTDGTATNSKINPTKGLYIKPGNDKADYTFTFSFNITNAEVSVTKTHKPVTVTYDANNATEGTAPTDDTQYEVGETVTVKTNSGNLARTGYTYDGWNTKNDGTGTTYSAVDPLGQFTITANTTLYAKWNTIPYTITYVLPEGASKGDNPDTYNIESAKITLKAASMTGKVFDGWFSEPEFTNQVTEIAKGSTGDRTLYAKFHDTQTYRLYYSNPEGWSTVKAYLWEESSKPNTNKNADWPGEDITSNTVVINNRTFYYYEFDETKGWDRIIFNNGSSQTSDITFSVPTNDGQYNNAKASATGTWQNLPEPIDPETPYTTVKVLCDYSSNVKIFFLNKSEDFMVRDAEEDGTSSEYLMNALGEQTIDEKTGYLYEVSFYGTSKMAIFVSSSHIGDNNKLTANDVDLTKAARVTYYYDLTGVTAGQPKSDTFSKIWVPLTQGYGTFCYPQAVQVSQAVPFWMQIQENQEETSGYELMMTAMDDNILPANTGALIYSKEKNAQAILTVVESTATYDDNDFSGTLVRTAMPTDLGEGEKVYVLGNSSGIAFYDYQPTSGYIPAYKAYFRLTPKEEPQGAPSRVKMTFRTEPATPTGVVNVNENVNENCKIMMNGRLYIRRSGVVYTINGQVVK